MTAAPGLKFVPVPEETGFAGVWELIKERTTPHPQPIVSNSCAWHLNNSNSNESSSSRHWRHGFLVLEEGL